MAPSTTYVRLSIRLNSHCVKWSFTDESESKQAAFSRTQIRHGSYKKKAHTTSARVDRMGIVPACVQQSPLYVEMSHHAMLNSRRVVYYVQSRQSHAMSPLTTRPERAMPQRWDTSSQKHTTGYANERSSVSLVPLFSISACDLSVVRFVC